MKKLPVLLLLGLTACFPPPRAYGPTSTPAAAPAPAYHDPSFDYGPQDLQAFLSQTLDGYTAEGPPVYGQLQSFAPLTVELERGHCYMMVLHLGPGAAFSEHARKGVAFQYHPKDGSPEIEGGPGIHGPGGAASAGCPQASTAAAFDMIANFGSAEDRSRVHDLGSGPYSLQLFSKPVSDAELAAQAADEQRQIAEQQELERQQAAREQQRRSSGCARCRQAHLECIADWRRGATRAQCDEEFSSCLFMEAGLSSEADCP